MKKLDKFNLNVPEVQSYMYVNYGISLYNTGKISSLFGVFPRLAVVKDFTAYGPPQAKGALEHAQNVPIQIHPTCAKSILRAFALHSYFP